MEIFALVIFYILGYLIHIFLCRRFNTNPQKIKTFLLYLFIALILAGALSQNLNLAALSLLIIGWSIILIDYEFHRIPNFITGYLSLLLLVIQLFQYHFLDSIIGGVEFLIFFGLLNIISRGGIGIGDVKLAGLIGLVIGRVTFLELINFTLLAAILGLLSTLGKSRPKRFKGGIAFAAPMLAAAIWIWPI
ncbi:MAG: prepilin peptidase [Actinobacteria bacterium]|nr:prepilin peptidase [Actinomycetota bacterium]